MPTGVMRSIRHSQAAATSGPGIHHTSPLKSRDQRKKKQALGLGPARKTKAAQDLRTRLAALLNPSAASSSTTQPSSNETDHEHAAGQESDVAMDDWVDEEPPAPPAIPIPRRIATGPTGPTAKERRHAAWDLLLPQLEAPLSLYREASHGRRPTTISTILRHECTASCGHPITATIHCMYITRS